MKRLGWLMAALVGALWMVDDNPASGGDTHEVDWIQQFGSAGFDSVDDVAADEGFVYATGRIAVGALPGESSQGGTDAFLRKYGPDGDVEWTTQFGTVGFDGFTHAEELDGSVFVAGMTTGEFPGEVGEGIDAFVSRFNASGDLMFVQQFGTDGFDGPLAIASDTSHLYMLGLTDGQFPGELNQGGMDFFLAKFDHNGEAIWVRQFGTAGDDPAVFTLGGIAVDETGVYVGSSVSSALPGEATAGPPDGFLAKFDLSGEQLWVNQFGTGCSDLLSSLSLQAGNLIVVGITLGDMADPYKAVCTEPPVRYRDYHTYAKTYVQRRDPDGSLVWNRQFAGNGLNDGHGASLGIDITTDSSGIYVVSEAVRTPAAQPYDPTCPGMGPSEDIHVRAYDFEGNVRWTEVLGTRATDAPSGVAVNSSGVYVGGNTQCGLPGQESFGSGDAVLIKITQ